jgi:hypothetical protein
MCWIGPHQLIETALCIFVVHVNVHLVAIVDRLVGESAGEPVACVAIHVRQNVKVDAGHD